MSGSHFIEQTSKFLLMDATAVTVGQGHGNAIQYISKVVKKAIEFPYQQIAKLDDVYVFGLGNMECKVPHIFSIIHQIVTKHSKLHDSQKWDICVIFSSQLVYKTRWIKSRNWHINYENLFTPATLSV